MLKERIKNDATQALKSGDQMISGTLRMLLAAVTTKEKDKRYKITKQKPDIAEEALLKESELTDEEVLETISSEVKKRKDAIALYEKGNRPELADKEKNEIEVLMKYLPEQISREQLEKMVQDSIAKVGAKEMKDTGKVMADLMPQVKGKADNSEISMIIKGILSK